MPKPKAPPDPSKTDTCPYCQSKFSIRGGALANHIWASLPCRNNDAEVRQHALALRRQQHSNALDNAHAPSYQPEGQRDATPDEPMDIDPPPFPPPENSDWNPASATNSFGNPYEATPSDQSQYQVEHDPSGGWVIPGPNLNTRWKTMAEADRGTDCIQGWQADDWELAKCLAQSGTSQSWIDRLLQTKFVSRRSHQCRTEYSVTLVLTLFLVQGKTSFVHILKIHV